MADRGREEQSFHERDVERMEKLAQEYERQGELLESLSASTAQAVQLYAQKTMLEEGDVVDRGLNRNKREPRFALEVRFLERLSRTVAELQEFLFRASLLVAGRKRYFHVDPESILMPVLQGSSDVAQILMAWEMLRSRLDLGHQFFLKYQKENRLPEAVTSFSPASTSSELQEELRNLPTADAQMRHVLAYYPHHYTAEGSKSCFTLSPIPTSPQPESYGMVKDPIERVQTPKMSIAAPQPRHSPLHPPPTLNEQPQIEEEEPSKYPLMSSGTPYQRAADFMTQWTGPEGRSASQAPLAKQETNIFRNLASGPIGGIGSQYRQTFGTDAYVNLRARGTRMGKGQQLKASAVPILPRPSNPLDIHSFTQTSSVTAGRLAHVATSTPKWNNNEGDAAPIPTFTATNRIIIRVKDRLEVPPLLEEAELIGGRAGVLPIARLASPPNRLVLQDRRIPLEAMEAEVEETEAVVEKHPVEDLPDQEVEEEDGLHIEGRWGQEAHKAFRAHPTRLDIR
ncbi:hypothetical protein B0H14DRAFT_2582813 [Mycena olivaceomarginata]|nr:hypothetical protein B0H14DRAFT_2582813 [Mycena olivaceomarginata]